MFNDMQILEDVLTIAQAYRNATLAQQTGVPFTPSPSTIKGTGELLDAVLKVAESRVKTGDHVRAQVGDQVYIGKIERWGVNLEVEETLIENVPGSHLKWASGYREWVNLADAKIERYE
ncbi:MAG: hypothetical protein Q8P23_02950 [bacterium]|nr:hypothetical protein [bacterium]